MGELLLDEGNISGEPACCCCCGCWVVISGGLVALGELGSDARCRGRIGDEGDTMVGTIGDGALVVVLEGFMITASLLLLSFD